MKIEKQNKESINRRSFMKRAWTWLGVIAGIELVGLSVNMLASGKNKKTDAASLVSAGFIESIRPGSVTPFKNGQFYLVRLDDGGLMALSLSCTHLGCSVAFDGSKNKFICPCHSSVFDIKGNVLNPPAPRAMDAYPVQISKGEILVNISRKIRRQHFSPDDVVYA